LRVLVVALAVLLLLAVLLWVAQRRLLYFPERYGEAEAERRARSLGLEGWSDRGKPIGWTARTPGARGRLVVLHGNAGSALDRTYFADAFRRAAPSFPLDVHLVEYPGYGARPGAPTEAAIVAATLDALRAARREGPGPVLLAGESLGSAAAAIAAGTEPALVDGLLLVTPLASVSAVARRHYPVVPAFLHRDPFRADLALPRYPGPVAFVLAGRDEVVFTDLGRALFDAYPGPKRLWEEPGAGHNTLDWRPGLGRWGEIAGFLLARP
jgi:pimeloyl-ACP methyl ester carboxylesterase